MSDLMDRKRAAGMLRSSASDCACSFNRRSSSRNDFNPHSLLSKAARIRRTSTFLEVSLSKIRGDIQVVATCTWLAADFRSNATTSRPNEFQVGETGEGAVGNLYNPKRIL
jgi:hypothetical protein